MTPTEMREKADHCDRLVNQLPFEHGQMFSKLLLNGDGLPIKPKCWPGNGKLFVTGRATKCPNLPTKPRPLADRGSLWVQG
jgi:hypothetical protein